MQIIIDLKLDNWNDTIGYCRVNKNYANIKKREEMEAIGYYLKGLPKIEKYPIEIECEWHIKNSRNDLDNKSLKSVLDCMQKVGIIENDNCKHITKIVYNYVKDDRDYLIMNIKEVE